MRIPVTICPNCKSQAKLNEVLTAQSNQNVIYQCKICCFTMKDIETSKGNNI